MNLKHNWFTCLALLAALSTTSALMAQTTELELQTVEVIGGTFGPGETMVAKSTYRNNGDTESGSFTLTYYLSTNRTINQNDTEIGSPVLVSVAAASGAMSTNNLSIPSGLAPGKYFIGAVIEFDDANTDNNTARAEGAFTFVGFTINAGLNDAWVGGPSPGGQGFFIAVFPVIKMMFVAMFTFDTELPDPSTMAIFGWAGHRWFTAFGPFEGDTAVMDIEITSGGIFDSPEPVPTQEVDGTLTIEFTDCDSGTITYNIPSINQMNSYPIQRLALDLVALCEELNAQ